MVVLFMFSLGLVLFGVWVILEAFDRGSPVVDKALLCYLSALVVAIAFTLVLKGLSLHGVEWARWMLSDVLYIVNL